jgi:SsrA-binding protein
MNKKENSDLVSNRRAYHDYEVLETYEAGIVLQGTEVKSLREAQASLDEAYVRVMDGELWLVGAYIAPYSHGTFDQHLEKRDRKLLMRAREINRLRMWAQEKGLTLIPLGFYLKKGRIKLRIARARGKKKYDKRAALKKRAEERRIQTALRRGK